MSSFFNVAHAHSRPSNKNAAMAVSGGLSYSAVFANDDVYDTPPPYFLQGETENRFVAFEPKYGKKVFRMTILGIAKGIPEVKTAPIFVCKCSCGLFSLRNKHALKEGNFPACGVCRQNFSRHLKQKFGDSKVTYKQCIEIWQRMGGA